MLDAIECDGVHEYPITVFNQGLSAMRHVQLTACSFAEIEGLLWQALEAGRDSFVILSHSFELLNRARDRPDEVVVRRFRKLCTFLDRHRRLFRVRGFNGLEPRLRTHDLPARLTSPIWKTGARMCNKSIAGGSIDVMGTPSLSLQVSAQRLDPLQHHGAAPGTSGEPLRCPCCGREPCSANRTREADSQGFCVHSIPLTGEVPPVRRIQDYLCYVPLKYSHYYIDLSISFDDYKRKFSSKTRSTVSRKITRYAKHCGGSIPWRLYKHPHEMREFFRHARAVSSNTYQERLLDAGLPDSEDFVLEMEALAANRQVRAYILFDGDRPVSYLYCPAREGVLTYAYVGYDPEYMKLSVGTVLQWLALEQLFEEQCFRYFDFTEGQSEHKRLFATHQVQCANIIFLKRTFRNAALVYGHLLMGRCSSSLGDSLERFGLKSKIKRLLRFAGRSMMRVG